MADGVTNIGGSWNAVPPGSGEFVLRGLLSSGRLSGQQIVDELIAQGYGDRGPAYYPPEPDRGGPFYALGKPHTYCSIEGHGDDRRWELTLTAEVTGPLPVKPGAPAPTPEPTPTPGGITRADLDAAVQTLSDRLASTEAKLIARVNGEGDLLANQIAVSTTTIEGRITAAVRNETISYRAIAKALAPFFPELGKLFDQPQALPVQGE